ncbi:GNAT family N-acetyltransferase [Pontibacillus marinus]|uniref:Acetyltransferase n=1 Tax=Pontibacillus marinus BH030004 = DSM 16465 TaxID=1385511 RepID=A0A0A5GI21_9BACI|nr:GNAT family protein [Pontibacillus marinus]KGX90770.1 acetyltransferase [Pontibacillus marinus BH030004 = DSM 16465]
MVFETERIYFRKLEKEDISILHRWQNDTEVYSNVSDSIDLYSKEDIEKFYDKIKNGKNFIIVEKNTNKEIGRVALPFLDYEQQNTEIIIMIGEKEYWGKGYGKESFQLLLDYIFNELNLHRVGLKVFSFNENAFKLYEKFGFQVEGKIRESFYRNGKWHDIYLMGLLKSEYLKGN